MNLFNDVMASLCRVPINPDPSKRLLCVAVLVLVALPIHVTANEVDGEADNTKPNFLIVVADDMGWSDISPFGSEIRTPTLQKLADEGLSMGQFYVAPTCAPTRAMLMTGVDNHRAGVGTQMKNQAPNQLEYEHYKGQLLPDVITIPEGLAALGYESVMAGKWHLAIDEAQQPNNRGFNRSFTLPRLTCQTIFIPPRTTPVS